MPATPSRALETPLRLFLTLLLLASTLVGLDTVRPVSSASAAVLTPASRYARLAIAIAPRYAGRPYRWGGTGPRSFDCSGYTKYVFARAGKYLPRVAAAQYRATRHISRTAARPGDLVFLVGRHGVYHVGIYAGRGTYWNAPHTGTVVQRSRIWGSWVAGRV